MTDKMIMLTLTRIETDHLRELIRQFTDLVNGTPSEDDPAVGRLAPDAYPDDPDASDEFRTITRGDLLHRRARDAALVRQALDAASSSTAPGTQDTPDEFVPVDIAIAQDSIDAWLRTFTALRLVIASRLGIDADDDRDHDDPRFAVYDWLGFRLDGLVQAADDLI